MVRENQTGQQSPNHKMHAELPQEITNAHQMALYHYQLRQRYDTMMGTALHSEHQRQHVPNMLNPYNTNPRIGANAFAPTNPLIHPAFPLLNFNANLSDSRIGNPSLDALMLQRGNTSSAGNFLYPYGHQFPLQPNVLGELAVNNSFGQQPEVPRTQPQMPLVNELHYVPFRNPHQHAGEAGERIRRMPVAFFPFASVAGHQRDQPDAVAHAGILNNSSLHQSKTQPETHHPYKVQPRRLSPQRKNGDEGYSSNTHDASSLTAQQNRSKRAKEEPSASQPSCKVHKLSAMPQQLPVESAPNLMSSSTSQQQADVVYKESCIGSMAASEYHVARQSTGSNPRSPDSSNYNQLIHYRNLTLGAHERKPIHTTSSKTSRHTEIYVEEKDSTYSPKTQKKSKKSNKHAPGTNSVGLEQKLQQRTPSKNESDPLSINGFQQQHASGEHRQLNRICMPHYYYPSAVAHHTHYSSNNISEISDNTNHEPSPHQRNTIPEAPTASAVQPKYTQPLRDSKYEDISDDEYDDVSSTQCSTYSLAAFKNNSKNAEETSSTLSSLGQEQSQQQSLVSSLKLMPASSFQPRYNKVNPPVHERSTALTSEFYGASQSKSGYPIVADTSQNNHLEQNWCRTAAALEKRPKQNMPPQNKARKEISVTNRNIVDLSSAVKSKSNMADNQPPMTSYRREESLKLIAQQEHVLSSTGVAQHTTEVDEQVKNLPTANSSLDHTKQGSLDDDSKASGTVHHAHGRKMAQKMANSHEKHANRPFPTQNNMNTEYFPTADTALNTKNERIETNTESQNTYGNVSDSTPARLNSYYTSLNSRTTMQLTQPANVYQQNSEVDERDNGKAVAFSLSATEQNCRGLQTINEHRKISNISGYSHTHHPFKTKMCETLTAHPEKPVEMLVSGNKGYEKLYSEITHYSTDLSTTQKNMETINFIDIQNSHNNVNGSIMKHSDPITSLPTYNPIEDHQEFRNSKLQFRTNVYMTDRIFAHPPPPLHHIDLNTLDVISAPPAHLTSVPHSRLPLVENFLYPHGHLLQPGSYATRESTSANNFIHEESTSPVIKQPTPLINAPEPMTPCNLQRDGAVDQRLNRISTAIPSFPSRTEHHGELATRNAYQELPDTLQYSLLPHQKYAMPSTRDDYEKQSKTTTTQGKYTKVSSSVDAPCKIDYITVQKKNIGETTNKSIPDILSLLSTNYSQKQASDVEAHVCETSTGQCKGAHNAGSNLETFKPSQLNNFLNKDMMFYSSAKQTPETPNKDQEGIFSSKIYGNAVSSTADEEIKHTSTNIRSHKIHVNTNDHKTSAETCQSSRSMTDNRHIVTAPSFRVDAADSTKTNQHRATTYPIFQQMKDGNSAIMINSDVRNNMPTSASRDSQNTCPSSKTAENRVLLEAHTCGINVTESASADQDSDSKGIKMDKKDETQTCEKNSRSLEFTNTNVTEQTINLIANTVQKVSILQPSLNKDNQALPTQSNNSFIEQCYSSQITVNTRTPNHNESNATNLMETDFAAGKDKESSPQHNKHTPPKQTGETLPIPSNNKIKHSEFVEQSHSTQTTAKSVLGTSRGETDSLVDKNTDYSMLHGKCAFHQSEDKTLLNQSKNRIKQVKLIEQCHSPETTLNSRTPIDRENLAVETNSTAEKDKDLLLQHDNFTPIATIPVSTTTHSTIRQVLDIDESSSQASSDIDTSPPIYMRSATPYSRSKKDNNRKNSIIKYAENDKVNQEPNPPILGLFELIKLGERGSSNETVQKPDISQIETPSDPCGSERSYGHIGLSRDTKPASQTSLDQDLTKKRDERPSSEKVEERCLKRRKMDTVSQAKHTSKTPQTDKSLNVSSSKGKTKLKKGSETVLQHANLTIPKSNLESHKGQMPSLFRTDSNQSGTAISKSDNTLVDKTFSGKSLTNQAVNDAKAMNNFLEASKKNFCYYLSLLPSEQDNRSEQKSRESDSLNTNKTAGEQRSSLNTDFQSPESQSGPPQLMKISPLERPNACFTANRGRPGLQPSPGDYGSPPILDRQVSPIVGGVDEEETKVDCHEYLPSERHLELPNQIGMRTASAAGVSPTLSELRFTLNSAASVTNTIYKPCFSNYSADKVKNNKANAALRLENPNQGESSHESSFPKTSFESTPKRPKPTAHRSRQRRNDKYQVISELPIRRRLPKEKSPKSDGFLNSTVGSFMGNNINKSLPQNTEDMPEYQNSSAKQQKHRLSTSGQGHKNLPLKKRNLKNWQNVPEYTVDTHKQDHTFIPSNRATDSLSKIFKDTAQPHFIKCKNQNEAEMNYVDVLSSGATSSESNLSATAEQGLTETNSISAHQRLPSYGANNQSELREATVITNANSNALTSNLLTETDDATKTLQANDVAFYQFYGEHNSDDSEDDNVGRLVMEDL